MSLISLAEKNNLPSLQLMDKETLGWIKSNKPNFSSGLAINKYSRAIKTDLLRFRLLIPGSKKKIISVHFTAYATFFGL